MDCIPYISEQYQVPQSIIKSVIKNESSWKNVISVNKDGSKDIGVMQINTWWLPILKKHNIFKADLMNVCTNIAVGSWILRYEYLHFKNWQNALASYNAGRGKYKNPYAQSYGRRILNDING